MKLVKLGLAISLVAGTTLANASEYSFGIQAGVGFGGETLIETETTTTTISAGDNLALGAFVNTPILFSDIYGKIAISTANESEVYTNAEESFSRIPLSFLLMKKTGAYTYGAGLTYHLNPSYELILTGSGYEKVDYSNALGFIIEANRTFSSGIEVGFSYTNIEYSGGTESGTTSFEINDTVDGSNFALTVGYTFN